MTVPFLDITRLHDSIRDEINQAIARVIDQSHFVGAHSSRSFEDAFAAAHGVDQAIGCGSGTDALTLALVALGVGPGDEVIIPSMTFVATAEAVVHAGATPKLADVDPTTLLLSRDTVAQARSDRTKAVIPVHLFGHMVDPAMMSIWKREGLIVVEDAAQAHLASFNGRGVGTVGDAACFSFYPGKNLGALGDGGAVITNNPDAAELVRRLRDHGSTQKYIHEEVGWCSRLDGIQAAVLEVKLRHLEAWTATRRRLAERYREHLGDLMVPWPSGSVHHLVATRISGGRRDLVAKQLAANGIQSGIHYPIALSNQPGLRRWARSTPTAERAATELLSLPIDPLMSENEVDLVSACLLSA